MSFLLKPLFIAAASRFLGFKDLTNPATGTGTIPSTTVNGVGGAVASISFNLPTAKSLSMIRIRVNGQAAGISNYWLPMKGALYVNTGGFQLVFIAKTQGTVRTINVGVNHFGSSATFGGCTFDYEAHFYAFPWA